MTSTDVPIQVAYGTVTGRFVSYLADSFDVLAVPDQMPLTGTVTLSPLTSITRWPTTTPPQLAIAQRIVAKVIDGYLCGPDALDATTPGVVVVATDQPQAQPNVIQWKAVFNLTGVSPQPADVVFNVPSGGTVDLALIASVPATPGTIVVVSHADALAAAASASTAAASASAAASSASAAAASTAAAPKWWQGTQAQYDALPVKDPNTLYVITP